MCVCVCVCVCVCMQRRNGIVETNLSNMRLAAGLGGDAHTCASHAIFRAFGLFYNVREGLNDFPSRGAVARVS